jgi:hypothetical protein
MDGLASIPGGLRANTKLCQGFVWLCQNPRFQLLVLALKKLGLRSCNRQADAVPEFIGKVIAKVLDSVVLHRLRKVLGCPKIPAEGSGTPDPCYGCHFGTAGNPGCFDSLNSRRSYPQNWD